MGVHGQYMSAHLLYVPPLDNFVEDEPHTSSRSDLPLVDGKYVLVKAAEAQAPLEEHAERGEGLA